MLHNVPFYTLEKLGNFSFSATGEAVCSGKNFF